MELTTARVNGEALSVVYVLIFATACRVAILNMEELESKKSKISGPNGPAHHLS